MADLDLDDEGAYRFTLKLMREGWGRAAAAYIVCEWWAVYRRYFPRPAPLPAPWRSTVEVLIDRNFGTLRRAGFP